MAGRHRKPRANLVPRVAFVGATATGALMLSSLTSFAAADTPSIVKIVPATWSAPLLADKHHDSGRDVGRRIHHPARDDNAVCLDWREGQIRRAHRDPRCGDNILGAVWHDGDHRGVRDDRGGRDHHDGGQHHDGGDRGGKHRRP